jgi:hypothetical protein
MRTKREWERSLEELLPTLEAEHDAEADEDVRDALWKLLCAVEEYLLMRDEKRGWLLAPSSTGVHPFVVRAFL